ncbi:hypothetical protein SteCoe_34558 [Stentor coeruleus]|uniref:Uncharacterized protein n=1 Tax=Stentor coeruleus TaxID=5963 RepID=A0A1R2AU85_9CILI|nr:hypothetical protein SteCoe_34558 [Stentor coeruleus]
MFHRITEGKKILLSKWNDHNKSLHQKNLKSIKGQIDTTCPVSYGSLKTKSKKEQLIEERYTEIERENKILLNKMSQIVNSRPNRQLSSTRRKSLNIEARKRQNTRIVIENQAILKRLQGKQPSYNVNKWEEERKNTEKRLKNICEFPYTLGAYDENIRKIDKTQEVGKNICEFPYTLGAYDENIRKIDKTQEIIRKYYKKLKETVSEKPGGTLGAYDENIRKSSRNCSRQNSRSRMIIRSSENTTKSSRKQSAKSQIKTQIVYKKGMSIGEKHYIVEIQKKHDLIVVLAFDIESTKSFCLEITCTMVNDIIGENEDYSILVKMLALENDELILVRNANDVKDMNRFEIGSERKGELDELIKECENVFHKKSYTDFSRGKEIDEFEFRGENYDQLSKYLEDQELGKKERKEGSGSFGKDKEGEVLNENIIESCSKKIIEREGEIEKNSENFFNDISFEEKSKNLFFEQKDEIDKFCSEDKAVENKTEIGKKDIKISRKSSDIEEIEETKLKISDNENEIIEKENKNNLENSQEYESKASYKSSSDKNLNSIKITPTEKNPHQSLHNNTDNFNSIKPLQNLLKSTDTLPENHKEAINPKTEENSLKKISKLPGYPLHHKEKKPENTLQKLEKISEQSLENLEKSSDKSLENLSENSVKSLGIPDKNLPKKTTSLTIPNNQLKDLFYNPIQTESSLPIENESKLKHPLKKSETEKEKVKASKSDSSDDENHILRKFESSSDEDYYSYSDSDDSSYETSGRFVPKNNSYGKTEAKTPEVHSNNVGDSKPVVDFKSYPNSPFTNYNEFQGFNRPLVSDNSEDKNKNNENTKENNTKSNLKSQISEKHPDYDDEIYTKTLNPTTIENSNIKMPINEHHQIQNDIKSKEIPYVKSVTIKDEKTEIQGKDKEKSSYNKHYSETEILNKCASNSINHTNDLKKLNLEQNTESPLDYTLLEPLPKVIITIADDPIPNPYTSKFSHNYHL